MTYRNRIKKPRSNRIKYWPERSVSWLEHKGIIHKAPYFKEYYREVCDPHTGKYIGWTESPFKDKQLKKQIRNGGKQACMLGVMEYEQEQELMDEELAELENIRLMDELAYERMELGLEELLEEEDILWGDPYDPYMDINLSLDY